MSKNMSTAAAQTAPRHGLQNVRTLVSCALLAAVSVVLARFIIPMPNETTRFSLEAVPIFLAGMLFGPLPGALVGFVADFVGCLFSGYGYNPMFCVPPILYGLAAGLFQPMLVKKTSVWTIALAFLPAITLGSILWQSFDFSGSRAQLDSTLRQLLWLSGWLTDREVVHQIDWLDPDTLEPQTKQIRAPQDLQELLRALLQTHLTGDTPTIAQRLYPNADWRYHIQPGSISST